MSTYPGETPQTPDDLPPADGTEETQPVGYWERRAAEQAREQEQQGHPDPTTPLPPGSSGPDEAGQNAYGQAPEANPYGPAAPGAQQGYGAYPSQGQPPRYQYPPAPDSFPGAFPGQPYGPYSPVVPPHPQSTLAMVLGLVGLVGAVFTCGLTLVVSPFAWAIGRSSLHGIRQSRGGLGGESNARAGMIMGIIGTVLLVLAVVALIAFVALVTLASTTTTTTGGSSV